MTQGSETARAGTNFGAYLRALSRFLFNSFTFTGGVLIVSIVVFLLDSASEQVNTLLTSQNAAALKLWNNLDYYEHYKGTGDSPLPPGLVNDLVDFSRTSANIKRAAHRLLLAHILGTDREEDEQEQMTEVVHPQNLNSNDIKTVVIEQIEIFQKHRAQVQDMAALDKTYVLAASTYILPCMYALLGAFLYTGRSRIDGNQNERLQHNDRYAMAFIFGATISLFSSLIPKDVLLSPLAVAFLAGYSIDVFTAHLDALVDKMKPHHLAEEPQSGSFTHG